MKGFEEILYAVIGTVIAYFIIRAFRRPRLISRVVHYSTFIATNQEPPVPGYSFTLWLENSGRETANNVRISHKIKPEVFEIHPDINYTTETLPGGGTDIIIPTLAPGQYIQIAYCLYSSIAWKDFIGIIRSDECVVKETEFPWLVKHPTIEKVLVILLIFTSIFYVTEMGPYFISRLPDLFNAFIELIVLISGRNS